MTENNETPTPTPVYRRRGVQIGAVVVLVITVVIASAVVSGNSRAPKPEMEMDEAFIHGLILIREEAFYEKLEKAGWQITTDAHRESAKQVAAAVCRRTRIGFTRREIVAALVEDNDITEQQAQTFVSASGDAFCAEDMRALPLR